jgi:hypothetical protein
MTTKRSDAGKLLSIAARAVAVVLLQNKDHDRWEMVVENIR